MYKYKIQKSYKNINPSNIWLLWTDVKGWSKWHLNIKSSTAPISFEKGQSFILVPKKGLPAKVKLIEIIEGKSFTDCTLFFGAKMLVKHDMENKEGDLVIKTIIEVIGPLKFIWNKIVVSSVAQSISEETDRLVHLSRGMK